MSKEDRFEKIYKKIVDEYNNIMELSRKDAKVENKYNILILLVIVIINIFLNLGIYKLIGYVSFEIISAFITVSVAIFAIIKHRGGKSKIEKYGNDFKVNVIGMMVKSFNDNFDFSPNDRINFRKL